MSTASFEKSMKKHKEKFKKKKYRKTLSEEDINSTIKDLRNREEYMNRDFYTSRSDEDFSFS